MNPSLKDLEARLEQLTPRGLGDQARDRCHATLDSLVGEIDEASAEGGGRFQGLAPVAAAAVALAAGIGGGWYFGVQPEAGGPEVARLAIPEAGNDFDRLDRESWLITEDAPNVYVTKNGEIREVFQEVEVTKEIVKHRGSGIVVTVETTDHHLVDSEKSEF